MDVIITSDARGKGMDSALIEESQKWAIDRKPEYIELDVLSNNDNDLFKRIMYFNVRSTGTASMFSWAFLKKNGGRHSKN